MSVSWNHRASFHSSSVPSRPPPGHCLRRLQVPLPWAAGSGKHPAGQTRRGQSPGQVHAVRCKRGSHSRHTQKRFPSVRFNPTSVFLPSITSSASSPLVQEGFRSMMAHTNWSQWYLIRGLQLWSLHCFLTFFCFISYHFKRTLNDRLRQGCI